MTRGIGADLSFKLHCPHRASEVATRRFAGERRVLLVGGFEVDRSVLASRVQVFARLVDFLPLAGVRGVPLVEALEDADHRAGVPRADTPALLAGFVLGRSLRFDRALDRQADRKRTP